MAEEFKQIILNTQEEADNFAKERISRVEKKYEGYVSPEEHQKAIQTSETYKEKISKYESEKKEWQTRESEYKAKISEYETNSAKKEIAKQYGLDESFYSRLQGSNEDEWKADAEKLSGLINGRRNQPGKGNNHGDVDDVYKKLLNGALRK